MSVDNVEKQDTARYGSVDRSGSVAKETLQENNVYNSEVLVDQDLMTNAYEAENREHEQGVWDAVKQQPMACFWAFIFSFTIVSPAIPRPFSPSETARCQSCS